MNLITSNKRFVVFWFVLGSLSCVMTQERNSLELTDANPINDTSITLEDLEKYEKENNIEGFVIKNPVSPPRMAFALREIKEPLWKNTKKPSGRDILYLLPYKITAIEYGGFALNFFYNQTSDMRKTFDDLFNLEKTLGCSDFLDFVENFLPENTPVETVKQLLPLFKKINIQERKAGLFFQGGVTKGPFSIQLQTSLQLGERNFWLSNQDRKEIEAILKARDDDYELDIKELYRIRIGLGDTRLKFGLNTTNMTSFQSDIGAEVIIPTSKFGYTTQLNIGIARATFETDDIERSAVTALRAIRDYLITPQLGNGHFGLGLYTEAKVDIFHDLAQLWMRLSYDILFPDEEDRIYLFKQTMTPQDLDPVIDPESPLTEAERINIVNNYIRQYMFPSSFKSTVHPGGILNFVFAANTNLTNRWKWALGYDFYAQQEESITKLLNTNIDMQELRIKDAQSPRVYQHKIFTEFFYHNKKPRKDLGVGIGGDLTISSHNIGEDWTVFFKVAASF